MASVAPDVVSLVMSAVLLWAGLDKASDIRPLVSTIRRLGLPAGAAAVVAPALALAEIATSVALVFRPASVVTLASVVALAAAFALAGLVALGRDEPIPCACFGAGGAGVLGRPQLYALMLWLVGVIMIAAGRIEGRSVTVGAALLATVALSITATRAMSVWRSVREARGDRLTAREMFVWLH